MLKFYTPLGTVITKCPNPVRNLELALMARMLLQIMSIERLIIHRQLIFDNSFPY